MQFCELACEGLRGLAELLPAVDQRVAALVLLYAVSDSHDYEENYWLSPWELEP